MMKFWTLGTNAVLSLFLVTGLGAGCAGDDDKQVVEAGGAGGEAGESNNGGSNDSGGSKSNGGSSNDGGASVGSGGDGGGAVAGSSGTGAGGDGGGGENTSVGGSGEGGDAGTTPLGGSAGAAEGGAGAAGAPVELPTPVPLACIGCASDSCIQARVACQANATCVACRDEDYSAPGCAQNVAFTNWVACICATGCAAVCSSVCGT